MADIIENDIIKLTEDLIYETNLDISKKEKLTLPISELALLGGTISSMAPAFRTITKDTNGLYRLVNGGAKGLKQAKDGTFWGATKTNKMGKFVASNGAEAIDPIMIVVAFALFSIEKKLGDISKVVNKIIKFLETDKEAEIEAD